MARTFGLPLLLVTLLVGGYLYSKQAKTEGPSSAAVARSEVQAQSAVAGTNFQAADQELQAYFAANGTYAGAALSPGSGVALVRADAGSFCLQAGSGTIAEHQVGPNGSPQTGAC
jgi:hypothetical protein